MEVNSGGELNMEADFGSDSFNRRILKGCRGRFKNMEASSGGVLNVEASFGGGFQYGGEFWGCFKYGGEFCRRVPIWRRIFS